MIAELLVLFHPWNCAWQLLRNVWDRLKKSWPRSDSRDRRELLSKRWDHQFSLESEFWLCRASLTRRRLEDSRRSAETSTRMVSLMVCFGPSGASSSAAISVRTTRLRPDCCSKWKQRWRIRRSLTTEAERRLSVQLFYVLALTCKGKSLQVVRRVPEGFGFEAWKQLCREFEPRLPSRFQGMLQALLSPTRTDDPVQTKNQWESRVIVFEQSGDEVPENTSWQSCRSIYVTESSLATWNFNQDAWQRTGWLARRRSTISVRSKRGRLALQTPWTCHRSEKARAARKERAKEKGTRCRSQSRVSTAASLATARASAGISQRHCGRRRCNQTKLDDTLAWKWTWDWQEEILRRKRIRNSCTCPCTWTRRLPPLRRGQWPWSLPVRVAHDRRGWRQPRRLDGSVPAGAIRHGSSQVGVPIDVQTRCPYPAVRGGPTASGGRHESCSLRFQVPQNGCRHSQNDVRNVTKPIVAAGQVTDAGQGVCLNGDGGFFLDKRSAKKIEKLLGDKERFIELRKQKGVYVIPCEDQMPGLFPLIGKESDQRKRMGMSDVMDEEDRLARTKRVLQSSQATKRERRIWGHACDVSQLVRGVRGRTRNRRRPQAFSKRVVGAHGGDGLRISWSRHWRRSGYDTGSGTESSRCSEEVAKYFERDPNLMPSAVCWPILTPGAWPKWCSKHLSTECGSSAAKGPWWRRAQKYSHQSNGAAENAVRRIESLTRTYVCVLQEKIGYKVDSKSIIPTVARSTCGVCTQQIHQSWRWSQCVGSTERKGVWQPASPDRRDSGLQNCARRDGETGAALGRGNFPGAYWREWRGDRGNSRRDRVCSVVQKARSQQAMGTGCIHNVHWRALEPQRLGGGGTSGKQQAPVFYEGAHPPVWWDTRVCSVSGNCFTAYSEV